MFGESLQENVQQESRGSFDGAEALARGVKGSSLLNHGVSFPVTHSPAITLSRPSLANRVHRQQGVLPVGHKALFRSEPCNSVSLIHSLPLLLRLHFPRAPVILTTPTSTHITMDSQPIQGGTAESGVCKAIHDVVAPQICTQAPSDGENECGEARCVEITTQYLRSSALPTFFRFLEQVLTFVIR